MKFLRFLALQAGLSEAALRFGCSTVSVQRLDPVVQPGEIPSAHVHQIVGGNAFNATMEGDIGEKGSCTTCAFTEDFSNYWTAVMYFKHENGSYKRVPQYPNAQLGTEGQDAPDINGGMTIYYSQKDLTSNGNQFITAFQPGFRMTVGSPTIDTLNETHTGLRYTCLETILTRGSETPDFPKQKCPAGIMAIHHFPACWDGKNLDSPDHQSHMYSTTKDLFLEAGPCPASHPVRMPQLAYETMWNTTAFADMWPADGSQPFVWSFANGNGSGYGTHADYMFGWKGDSLQRAMNDSCMFHACGSPGHDGILKTQPVSEMNKCAVQNTVTENVGIDEWISELPGQSMGGV
ncbi:hypothetical protein GGR57DRAFT_505517 [Xylariaceae sp. FL1272]|nr:hypothetical protein GGR57DRAFT_505517 [Xylariaceae sp. FL1272]